MRAGQAFLAGAVALGLCLALASRAAAKPFNLSSAVLNETIDTINGTPVDCLDYPTASDSYVWTANLTNVKTYVKSNFMTDPAFVVFVSNSCSALSATTVTNTLVIPADTANIKAKNGVVTISFSGAVPDFNTYNITADLPFFDYMTFQMQYSTATGAGTLQVSGNANLCDNLAAGPPQCLLLDVASGYSCACMTLPLQNTLDITSLFQ